MGDQGSKRIFNDVDLPPPALLLLMASQRSQFHLADSLPYELLGPEVRVLFKLPQLQRLAEGLTRRLYLGQGHVPLYESHNPFHEHL